MTTRGGGLARRLLLALALVLATAGITAWLVAGAVGPPLFHDHLLVAHGEEAAAVARHAEIAFREASALALGIALLAATGAALVVSLVLTRRIGRSLTALTTAAEQVAGGRYEARVPAPGIGTEFTALTEAFNEMAARLQASEALRHRLLSDVAHELRTPVATLTGHLEGLEDGVSELTPELVAVLRAQGARLTRLSEDLAAVTRAESGELALALVVTDAAELLRVAHLAAADRAATQRVDLVLAETAGRTHVRADADRMGQVLGNLVDNALRHTRAGGQVTLAATAGAGTVRLTVTDTGEGIAPEHLPHVFERFYRAESARDRTSGGSGIGLAITKALVEAHGGHVTASSDGPGRGATFTVALPAAQPSDDGRPPQPRPA